MTTPADRAMEVNDENWPTIRKLYDETASRFMKAGEARGDALRHASQVVGLQLTPPISGDEFRSLVAVRMNQTKYSNGRKAPKRAKKARLVSASVVDELWGGQPADLELGPTERAYQLLRGMAKGETRFEVCVSEALARSIQQRIPLASDRLKYRKNSVATVILPNEARQAGERRWLLAAKRS